MIVGGMFIIPEKLEWLKILIYFFLLPSDTYLTQKSELSTPCYTYLRTMYYLFVPIELSDSTFLSFVVPVGIYNSQI